jgi:hypothetical protein
MYQRVFKSRMICPKHIARMEEMKYAYKVPIRKPQGKSPLRRHGQTRG